MKTPAIPKRRTTRKVCQLPNELMGRLLSLHGHHNPREQRDTFSTIFRHPGGTYRWNAHLLVLPYSHLIESEHYGEKLAVHLYHPRSGNIFTLENPKGKWSRKAITSEDKIQHIVPLRFCRTGWLSRKATEQQNRAVARITGIRKKQLPILTAANANIIIQSSALMNHIKAVAPMFNEWIDEIPNERRTAM